MIAHCLDCLPEEGCGLLVGSPAGGSGARGATEHVALVTDVVPVTNASHSARVYSLDPGEHLRADRAAEAAGHSVLGVFHSHTHTDAYPSPTDVAAAPDPAWHYAIVSLRGALPALRSFRIAGGKIAEERVVL
jgi:proteasome lid subunit RPN8/RPN11